VLPLVLNLPVMCEEDMFKALRSSDVDEQYLNNPDFIRLLGDTGGVPGLARCVLEGLTVQYDVARIPIARALAQEYINSKMRHIPLRVVRALLPVVLTGQTVFQGSTVAKNHSTTYDDLQVQGSVWLTKVPGTVAEYHAVVPVMVLMSICSQHTTDVEVSRVTHMIEFLGWHHSFISRTLSRARFPWSPPVTLGELYRGVEMHTGLAATQLALRDTTDYKVEPRRAGGEEHSFPQSVRLQRDSRAKKEAKQVASQLLRGSVVLNSAGAAVGILQVDPLAWGRGVLVRALCVAHTVDDTSLSNDKVAIDRAKAVHAVRNCKQLAALCSGGALKCIVVHITNGPIPTDVDLTPPDAIVIGKHNMKAFLGPVLGRCMMPSRAPLPNTVGERLGQKRGCCTLRALPLLRSTLLHTGVRRLALQVSSLLFRYA
jgi:hypothetical protein